VDTGLANKPQSYKVEYLKDATTTQSTNGDWISYEGASPSKVNYGAANFSKSYPSCPTCPPQRLMLPNDDDNNGRDAGAEAKPPQRDDSEERYVSDVILSDIIRKCSEKNVNDYESYSNVVWETFFHEKKSKYLNVGKIFIGSENSLAVFPYRAREYTLDVKSRDWWKAAYGVEGGKQVPSDFYDLISKSGNTGLSIIYPDIVSEEGTTDLNRTIWFKFNKYGKKFVLGIDLRLADFSFNVLNEVRYEIIALGRSA
jgi:hypothetical protein